MSKSNECYGCVWNKIAECKKDFCILPCCIKPDEQHAEITDKQHAEITDKQKKGGDELGS